MQPRAVHLIVFFGLVAAAAGCGNGPERDPSLAEAFTGPISLKLREEITPGTKIVATVKHGDRLEVLQIRRRFVRVRTPQGVEGWTDLRQLMTPEQMAELRQLFERAKDLPSQGEATVYDALNVHTLPLRQSPSFYQITEGERVDVLAHQIAPRTGGPAPPVFSIPKPPPPVRKKKSHGDDKLPPPPKAPAPEPPENWLELSKIEDDEEEPEEEPVKTAPLPPVRMEDWNLIRTQDGKAGWVLARNLLLAIPDEVAQYAEGHRITSYFSLGKVVDTETGETKHHWLWTTHSDNAQPFQFDGFRVFIWAMRKHRYETTYIERRVKGYFPVEVKQGSTPTFSLLLEEEDGKVYRKTYIFELNLVRKIGEQPAAKPLPMVDLASLKDHYGRQSRAPAPIDKKKSIAERIKGFFGG